MWTTGQVLTRHFVHLKDGTPPEVRTLLLSAVLADAINLGLTKMAESCPGTIYAKLSWLQAWHIRDETYSAALAELVNAQFHQAAVRNKAQQDTSCSCAFFDDVPRIPGFRFYCHLYYHPGYLSHHSLVFLNRKNRSFASSFMTCESSSSCFHSVGIEPAPRLAPRMFPVMAPVLSLSPL